MERLYENQLAYGIRPQSVLKRVKPYWLRLNQNLFGISDSWMTRMKTVQTLNDYAELLKEYGND